MWIEELETRLDEAFQDLERSIQQQQQIWQRDYQHLQQQLVQAKQRDAQLCEQIKQLVDRLNAMDSSPERNPLLHKVKIISAHLDALAKDASDFLRSLP
ncbi:hypothetical protein BIY26_05710 [Brenneria goodwinii]|uniref:Uncharacterized protein n=1 Tax=Brenneria goodwinii TaxID=1109412 RepID=A0AAE8ESU9_9GAMM|nr:MbeD/MobD family mobilization/exclusion protein [Brenneria goodwinii]ATA25423.1 hypothetical protein AWC36_15580 [Brenneria goodwinii]MCG8156520.1 hypothetical protein [Brenneria goodwinii]MCG8162109.1 hypothetical protein [Brenneria goodwinii]MCG8166849.1 hypothetical protein [Brenneria goodwinii]MCG8171499.1 hypothetical protein [Brenneria goodwinii]